MFIHLSIHLIDLKRRRFLDNDVLFTYASVDGVRPLRIKHGLHLDPTKIRDVAKPIDMREAIEIRFGRAKQIYRKGMWRTYEEMVNRARFEQGFQEDWVVTQVRAEEDRIIVTGGIPPKGRPPESRNWRIEIAWRPLSTTGDAVRETAKRVP
jgi:hypothetical protein